MTREEKIAEALRVYLDTCDTVRQPGLVDRERCAYCRAWDAYQHTIATATDDEPEERT